jgi:predicted Zn finger-like uncharacterized protein
MILSCNSCEKKFVVPDNAITSGGRLVQCSSCGNKWTQFPVKNNLKENNQNNKPLLEPQKISTSYKAKKKNVKKRTGPYLYSPEYLAKKHGIKINEKPNVKQNKIVNKDKINLGFYNSLIVLIVVITFTLRTIYFSQDIIVQYIPNSEIYIDYLFETIKNIKEIIQSFLMEY